MGAYKKEKKKKEESFFLLLQTKQGKEVYFSLFFSSFLFPNIYVKLFFSPVLFLFIFLFLLQPNSELGGKEHSISNNSVWQNGGEEKGEAERGIKGNRRERKIVGYKGNSGRK